MEERSGAARAAAKASICLYGEMAQHPSSGQLGSSRWGCPKGERVKEDIRLVNELFV
jgi:hypothetical protein